MPLAQEWPSSYDAVLSTEPSGRGAAGVSPASPDLHSTDGGMAVSSQGVKVLKRAWCFPTSLLLRELIGCFIHTHRSALGVRKDIEDQLHNLQMEM